MTDSGRMSIFEEIFCCDFDVAEVNHESLVIGGQIEIEL